MESYLFLTVLVVVIGQSASQLQNQPINGQLGNRGGNYVNVNTGRNANLGNQLNSLIRQQVQQQNLVKQFNQDQFAQQNLAGGAGYQQNQNVQPQAVNVGAQAVGANVNQGGVVQNNVVNNNPPAAVNQNEQSNRIEAVPGVVHTGGNSVQGRILNTGFIQPNQLRAGNQGQQQNAVNQANQAHQVNLINQPNIVNQPNQYQPNQPNQVNPVGEVKHIVQPNQINNGDTHLNEANRVGGADQGVNSQVKEVVKVPEAASADKIANDDRERSARLEQHVDTPSNNDNVGARVVVKPVENNNINDNNNNNNENNNNNNNNDNDHANAHVVNPPQQVNNIGSNYQNFQGGGVNMNVPNNYQRPPEREIGGMRLTWDWSDFAITFDDYGGAEQKVRRAPHATTGEPWPLPQYYVKKEKRVYKLDKDLFTFKVIGETCDIIQDAVERYRTRVLEDAVEDMYDNLQNAPGTNVDDPALKYDSDVYTKAQVIAKVDIKIRKPCQKYPSVNSDESYDLVVKKSRAFIWANEVWGALRGLETFSHIVWRGLDGDDPDDRQKNGNLFVKETVISDYPRFPHRGVLVDSSRHFFFKETIFDILDGMEQNKMNVLHWHIVDDQSFPYQSAVFPDLSRKGAFHPTFVYTQKDITEIIDYARFRGIRVMPEFDTPGHTYSWGLSRPELLTQCYQGGNPVKGYLGPMDPTKNSTYRFLRTLFAEVLDTFKDQYIHLGGDEVPLGCWQSNPDVVNFGMELSKQSNGGSQSSASYNSYFPSQFDVRKVYEYYENRLMKDLRDIGRHRKDGVKFVMWQEVMNNDLQLPNDTIIEVWMGDMADVNRAISMGYQVLYATCWYLDHVEYGTKWPKYYQCDPADNTFGYMIDEKKVLGGEACLWAEYIDNENMMTTLWPRASAVAERLWSAKDVRDLDTAGARLSEHRCRMLSRGLSVAQISGPDYCLKRGIGRSRDKYRTNSTCTSGRCVKSRDGTFVEMDDMEPHQPHRHSKGQDCPKVPAQGGMLILLGTVMVIILAIGIGVKSTTGRFSHARVLCKNRTILILFISVLLIYFLCYTSIWMQVFDFSSFRKKRESGLHLRRSS